MKSKKIKYLLVVMMFTALSIMSVQAGSDSTIFPNGGHGLLNVSRNSASSTAYHVGGLPCYVKMTITMESGYIDYLSPVSGLGNSTSIKNNLKYAAGAQSTVMINGITRYLIASAS